MEINVTIKGISPILMNRFTAESEMELSSGTRPTTKEKLPPREAADKVAYKDNKGNLYVPGECVLACIVEAGRFHKLGKNKVTTQKTSMITGGIQINELVLPLNTKKFEVDSRRVVNPSTQGAVIKHRPRLDNWLLTFSLDVDETIFPESFVRELLDTAGKRCGLLDYRPSRKGPFGRFVVSDWSNGKSKKKK